MPNATVPGLTIEQLRSLANDAEQTQRQLKSVLASLAGSAEEAQWAGEALENCGVPQPEATASLATLANHPDELVASWACKLLARIGVAASQAEEALVTALTRHNGQLVREEAARALGELENLSAATRAALMTAAAQGGPRLKRLANASLGD